MKRFKRFGLSELLRNDEAIFVPVDYGASKLPFLTISTLYADFLKCQLIDMLTFVNAANMFSNFATCFFVSISTVYAVFLKCQLIDMLTFVNSANTFITLLLASLYL